MKTVPLSDWVEELESGSRPKGGIKYGNGDVPSLGAEHLSNDGGFNFRSIKKIPASFYSEMSRGRIKHGDILIVKDGATTGKVSYVNGNFPFNDAAINEHVFRLAVNKKKADPAFVFRFLQSPSGQAGILSDFRGATVGGIGRTFVDKVQVPEIGPEEQRRIAAVLDKADAIRRKCEQSLALADDLLKSAFVHMVGYKNPEYGRWLPHRIEQLAEDKKGAMRTGPFGSALRHGEFVDDGIAVLGIDNAVQNQFAWGERRFITEEKYADLQRYRVFPGDIIITIMGTTGRSAVVPDDIPPAITTKHLATITCNRSLVFPEFLSFAIHSDPIVVRQVHQANKGAIMDGLNLGIIRGLQIKLPPLHVQEKFVELLARVRSISDRYISKNGSGSDLFSSLSQCAFRGDL